MKQISNNGYEMSHTATLVHVALCNAATYVSTESMSLDVHQNKRFGFPPPTAPYVSSSRGDFLGDGDGTCCPPRF